MDRGIRRFELCPAKKSPRQTKRSDDRFTTRNTPTHATMAAIVAPVAILAPRVTAPKARAARTLRATTFNGVKVAQPKVREARRSLCRGKTSCDSRRACDIFHRVAHRRARGGPRPARGTKSGPRRARIARAVSLRGVPLRAIPFRAPRDPRQARIRTGRVPAFAVSFPRRLSLAFGDSRAVSSSLFFAFRMKKRNCSSFRSLRDKLDADANLAAN